MKQIRVLLAEDDDDARTLLAQVLVACGHVVVAQVRTGREAVDRALSYAPDVVLLDVHMPDGSGLEAAEEITHANPGIAVILFTGDASLALSDAAVDATAAVAFLQKPATPTVLDAAVRLARARGRRLEALRADADVARADAETARAETEDARRRLADRKLIERAKGLVMRQTGLAESAAFRLMQRSAQNRGVHLVAVATQIIEAPPPWDLLAGADA